MKSILDYLKNYPFKNFFALLLSWYLLKIMNEQPAMKDLLIVLLTLIVKHFFDSTTGSVAKDVTISKALDQAQQLPATGTGATVQNAETVNVKK